MLAFLSLFFIALFSICFKMCTKKSDKDLMRGHQVVADLFFFLQEVRLEKHYMGASTHSMEIKIT